jgi:uncharacterized membrane protein
MEYGQFMEKVGQVIDAAGVLVIVLGLLLASLSYLRRWWKEGRHEPHDAYRIYRAAVGRGILLGLEFLIAGDIIRTVAIDLSFQNLGTLAILVIIRSFLSINLEMEIEGRWPWQSGRKIPTARPDVKGASLARE